MIHNDHAEYLLNIETPTNDYDSKKSNRKTKKQRKTSKFKSNVTNFPTPKSQVKPLNPLLK